MPAVNLVPPAFPVTMSVPPPGYSGIPPPPFLRASFNPSQPPPGKVIFPFYNIYQNVLALLFISLTFTFAENFA